MWDLPRSTHWCFISPLSGFKHIRTLIFNRFLCFFRKRLNHSNHISSGLATMVYFNFNICTGCNLRKISRNQCGSSRFAKGLAVRHISSPAWKQKVQNWHDPCIDRHQIWSCRSGIKLTRDRRDFKNNMLWIRWIYIPELILSLLYYKNDCDIK